MADSKFYISIKDIDGEEVSLKPGGHAEYNLLKEIKSLLVEQGVGWFKSEAKVLAALDTALKGALFKVKSDVLPTIRK